MLIDCKHSHLMSLKLKPNSFDPMFHLQHDCMHFKISEIFFCRQVKSSKDEMDVITFLLGSLAIFNVMHQFQADEKAEEQKLFRETRIGMYV